MAVPQLERALKVVNDHYHWRNGALMVFGVVATAVIQNNAPVPYVWVWSLWFLLFLALFLAGARPVKRVVWFNLAFVFFALAAVEAYLTPDWHTLDVRRERTERLTTEDGVLGYRPRKNRSIRVQKYLDQTLVYDVVYTIDGRGLRSAGSETADGNACEVVAFGGSYTFGAGVNDDESWPAVAELESQGRARLRNFAYVGYGPHQMLAALENGLVEQRLDGEPKYAFYLAISDHIRRAAGMREWDGQGPRFRLRDDGQVIREGTFADDLFKRAVVTLGRSYVLRRFIVSPVGPDEVALFVGIVAKAARTFEERFRGAAFHVIVWDVNASPHMVSATAALRERGIPVHLVSDIAGNIAQRPAYYRIHEHDGHPNSRAHALIGRYVAKQVMRGVSCRAEKGEEMRPGAERHGPDGSQGAKREGSD